MDGGLDLKIIGVKHLNTNNYKSISILHNEVFVSSDNHNSNEMIGKKKFTETLRGLDKKQIVSKIIEYFLQSHSIKSISNYEFSGNAINVSGDDETLLKIGVPIDIEVARKLMMKYKHDRLSFIENMNLVDSDISISMLDGKSSYDYDGKRYKFLLSCKNGSIRDFERNFLTKFIGKMLVDGEVVMTREEIFDGSDSSKISFLEKSDNGFRRYFGYKAPTIIVDNGLVPEIEAITINHNKAYNNAKDNGNKVLKKRMEEFK